MERLAVSNGSFPADRGQMDGVAGSVCIIMERPAAAICEMATPAWYLGDQRSLFQLEEAPRVCLPPLFIDKRLSIEGQSGAIESGPGLPFLAESAVVSSSIGTGGRRAVDAAATPETAPIQPRSTTPSLSR